MKAKIKKTGEIVEDSKTKYSIFDLNNEIEKIKGMYAPFWLHSFKNNAKAHYSNKTVGSLFLQQKE